MWTHVIVEGSGKGNPGLFGGSNLTEYVCYVSYSSVQCNKDLIKRYFLDYCGFDYDELEFGGRPPIDDYNCAQAILSYFFRDKWLRFEYRDHKFSRPKEFPSRIPDKESDQYKVWVETSEEKQITTPKSAAWMLYETVECGKISVNQAKLLVNDKYPEHMCYWSQILIEFRKYGGAYTEKYLRRR